MQTAMVNGLQQQKQQGWKHTSARPLLHVWHGLHMQISELQPVECRRGRGCIPSADAAGEVAGEVSGEAAGEAAQEWQDAPW